MSFQGASPLELMKWVEARINGGMVTSVDAADIEDRQLVLCKNARVRYDKTSRRPGHSALLPSRPNTQPVLRLASLVDNQNNSSTYRFTPVGVHRRDASAWVIVTPVSVALAGTVLDRIKTVVINNQFVFANNGANFIQKINQGADTYERLGNAPKYRYITGFYDRVVAANRTDGGSFNVEIGWSGQGAIEEWDNSVDPSAGTSPLIESPDDFGDPITGLFGIANVLVILREHSLWIGSKNPVASNPFSFYNAVPKIGCNAPWSAAAFERGLIWFDQRTATVWLYEVGGGLSNLGRPIDDSLIKNIDDPAKIFASYNPIQNEYILCIPVIGTSLVKAWTFNFRTKAWSYDEIDDICSADDVDVGFGYVAIDDLIGRIDQLNTTIDGLNPAGQIIPVRSYGKNDGVIIYEDTNADTDSGVTFDTDIVSKQYEIPQDDIIVANIRLEIQAQNECDLVLWIKKNENLDWTAVRVSTIRTLNKTVIFQYNKQMRCRKFQWRLTCESGGVFHLMKYEVQVYGSGKSKR